MDIYDLLTLSECHCIAIQICLKGAGLIVLYHMSADAVTDVKQIVVWFMVMIACAIVWVGVKCDSLPLIPFMPHTISQEVTGKVRVRKVSLKALSFFLSPFLSLVFVHLY